MQTISYILPKFSISKLEYVGQNQVSGQHPKKSGVISFKPKLLTPKHSVYKQATDDT